MDLQKKYRWGVVVTDEMQGDEVADDEVQEDSEEGEGDLQWASAPVAW